MVLRDGGFRVAGPRDREIWKWNGFEPGSLAVERRDGKAAFGSSEHRVGKQFGGRVQDRGSVDVERSGGEGAFGPLNRRVGKRRSGKVRSREALVRNGSEKRGLSGRLIDGSENIGTERFRTRMAPRRPIVEKMAFGSLDHRKGSASERGLGSGRCVAERSGGIAASGPPDGRVGKRQSGAVWTGKQRCGTVRRIEGSRVVCPPDREGFEAERSKGWKP